MDAYASGWASQEPSCDGIGAELGTAPGPAAPNRPARKSERVTVEMGAGLRQRGASGVSVQVMDLSTHGFRVATHLDLAVDTQVWLRLPGLEPIHARVMWCKGHFAGCAFEQPLHPAVLDMVVAKARGR